MRDRDVLRSCDFGRYIGKLRVNLFFVGILLLLCMVIFPLQVQAEKKEADTGVDRELDTGLEKEADSGNEFFRAGEEYLKAGSVGKPCRDRRLYQRGTGGRT